MSVVFHRCLNGLKVTCLWKLNHSHGKFWKIPVKWAEPRVTAEDERMGWMEALFPTSTVNNILFATVKMFELKMTFQKCTHPCWNETMADSFLQWVLLMLCNLSANCCISQRTQMWKSQEHPTVTDVLYFGLIRLNLIISRHEHEKIDEN